jgi:hypothetical protein
MPYYFTPPTYQLKNANAGPLLSRYYMDHGYAVVKRGSTYENIINPAQDLWDTADAVYLGGHKHLVTDAEAALLNAAGYSTTLE